MRVLHVIGPMRTGGAQTQLLGLVKAAHGVHWDATVVATSSGSMSRAFRAAGVPFVELRRWGSPGLGRMLKVRALVGRGQFDIIHGNLWQANIYCRVAVIGRRPRPSVVISERNVETHRSWLKRWLDARLAGVTDAYVGNTGKVVEFIHDVHPVGRSIVSMIPNGVDTDVFRPRLPTGNLHAVVGSVGRLDPEKGHAVLIHAIRLLRRRGVSVVLRIAGEGPLEKELQQLAGDLPIQLVGELDPGPAVADFLRGLDVFCLPSTSREGRPNVVVEALATDLPVVATAIAGLEELLRADMLVPPGDAESLACAIEQALADPEGWKRRSSPASVRGFDDLAREYADLFGRVLTCSDRRNRYSPGS